MVLKRWRVWTVLTVLLLVGGVTGDRAAAIPVGSGGGPAGVSIRALTTASSSVPTMTRGTAWPGEASPVPADFAAVMGYQPVRATDATGRAWWVAPDGACSAPTGATRYDFSIPCKAHDLGYDLLRYAAATGHPLGSWAREAVDSAFGAALAARCVTLHDSIGCRLAAAVYHGVVVANSWRQDWREPRPEPALPWIALAIALTLAPVLLNALLCRRDGLDGASSPSGAARCAIEHPGARRRVVRPR